MVDLGDTGMVQPAEKLVFELEATQHHRGHDAGPHDFQRDASLRPLLLGFIHDAHRAFADERQNLEWTNPRGV